MTEPSTLSVPLVGSTDSEDVIHVKRDNSEKKIMNPNYVAARASFTASIEQQQQNNKPSHIPVPTRTRGSYTAAGQPNGTRSSFTGAGTTIKTDTRTRSSFTAAATTPPSSSTNTSSSSNNNNSNKNWEQEILSQRKDTVKDISARFKGASKIETMADYEQRVRTYKKMKTMNYFQLKKTDLKNLSVKNKLKIMNEWQSLFTTEQLSTMTSENAKEFLSQYNLTVDELTKEQWNEWLEAIEITLAGKNNSILASHSDSHSAMLPATPDRQNNANQQNVNDLSELDLKYVDFNVSYDSVDDPSPGGHQIHDLEPLSVTKKRLSSKIGENNENNEDKEGNEAKISHYWSNSFLSPHAVYSPVKGANFSEGFNNKSDDPTATLFAEDPVNATENSNLIPTQDKKDDTPVEKTEIIEQTATATITTEEEVINPLARNVVASPKNERISESSEEEKNDAIQKPALFEIALATPRPSENPSSLVQKREVDRATTPVSANNVNNTSNNDRSSAPSSPKNPPQANSTTTSEKKGGLFSCCSCLFGR